MRRIQSNTTEEDLEIEERRVIRKSWEFQGNVRDGPSQL